ncbi:MAG: UDP-N-acetylmuramoyl-L-alanyl-D-glutamate--2,6-diaminopimelate ligase [Patescibacteria group bacterium]|jgi:UDP-N-acetylmuramoyl-L-alanyl-D-glutamate--2,6-diaminopimelate ligase
MLTEIKKLIPAVWLAAYHKLLAVLADIIYGRPSEKMVVIGVTGTNGKSSTVSLIAEILEKAGYRVGAASTTLFKLADKEWLNDKKMTMLGRFALQKLLRQMVAAGCRYAVIETSSQGIEQYRHLGIHYDVCVFTNLTPEHIEAHGGFDNYKKAKLKLFKHLADAPVKAIGGRKIAKAIVVNGDDRQAKEFLDFQVDKKIVFGLADGNQLKAENISYRPNGVSFTVGEEKFDLKLFGKFNIYNSLAALAVAQSQGISLEQCRQALEQVGGVPGRMEFIIAGQPFKVLVDYAPEPESMRQLFATIREHQLVDSGNKIIHVFGSCGGGRDVSRRSVLGELSAQNADVCIVTDEDPYDDDPQMIIDQVAAGAKAIGKIEGDNLFRILDRREAIKFALSRAQAGDLVLLTGKGSEQVICVANGLKLKWDEREVVRELLKQFFGF